MFRKKEINNEFVYEKKVVIASPEFTSHNYGFRPGKSVHQALQNVRHWRTTTTFFVKYDIKKAFDNVNRKRLKNIFCKKIIDMRF